MKLLFRSHFLILGALLLIGGMSTACESDLARRISQYEKTRDYQSAKDLLRRSIRSDPQNAEAHFMLGRIRMQQGNYEKGLSSLKSSRDLSAQYVDRIKFLKEKYAHKEFKKGKDASSSGAYQKSIRHFRNVTLIQPSNASAHLALGHVLTEAGMSRPAEEAYRTAIGINPTVEALNNLSALSYQRGAYRKAIQYSQRALDLDTDASREARPELVTRVAYAHLQAEQFPKAQERFRQALEVGASREVRRDFALALYNRQKHGEALPLLQRLAVPEDADRRLLHALGDTYLSLEQPKEAVETYQRLHQENPQDADALQSLVIAYQMMDREEKANAYLDQLNSLSNEGK